MLKSIYAGLMRSKWGLASLLVFFSIMAMSLAVGNTAQASTTPKVKAGYNHTIALKSDGTVWAWGRNYEGQLGDGTTTTVSPFGKTTPVPVSGLSGVIAITGGETHALGFIQA